jgi:hypothetical protein
VSLLRLLALALAVTLVLVACKSGGDRDDGADVFTITSDDGKLTLEIPRGLLDDETEVTITSVPQDELPEELAGLQGAADGYLLEPDGLELDEPITATLTLDIADLEDWPEDGADGYGLVSFSEEAGREILDETTTTYTYGADTMSISGRLSHFSSLVRTKSSLRASLEQVGPEFPVGTEFQPRSDLTNTDTSDTVILKNSSASFLDGGSVVSLRGPTKARDVGPGGVVLIEPQFRCESAGSGTYGVKVTATSVVKDSPGSGTPLAIVLDALVTCVESEENGQGAATPTRIASNLPPGLSRYLVSWGVPEDDLARVASTPDAQGDHFYSDPSQTPGFTPDYTDFAIIVAARVTLTQEVADTLNSLYPCGETADNGVQTLCQSPNATVPAGDALIVAGSTYGEFPATPDRQCILSWAFDAPGGPVQAIPPHTDDVLRDAGTWYEVVIPTAGPPAFSASRISAAQEITPITTQGRFFFDRNNMTQGGIIPAGELTGATGVRGSALCGDSSFTPEETGADTAPDVPGFGPIPDDVIKLEQICGGTCVGLEPRRRIL